jgi:hypothetical protein
VSRIHRLPLADRVFFVTVSLRRQTEPFTSSEYPLLIEVLEAPRRRLALRRGIGSWTLTSLQQRLAKTGGRLIRHAGYYGLLLGESHLTRRLFGAMLGRIAALPSPAG